MQKKKGIIILIIIIMIILLFGVVIAGVYLKTDLLKTDKQLFFKYLLQENQMLEVLKNENQEKNSKSYIGNGSIDFIYEYNNEIEINENDQIGKQLQENLEKLEKLQNLTGTIESNVDKENKKEYYELQLEKDEEKIMDFELVRDEEKYALKSKQIANAYIGIENNNLKEFFKKMGIENDEIIPDKVDIEKIYKAITGINKDEKEHIYETYKEVLFQSIDNSNYSKKESQKINIGNNEYNADLYTLTLNKTESIDSLIKILQTLKRDSITLNMICNKIKVINPESDINISKLVEQIDSYIDEVSKIEKSDTEFIRIDVYVDKKVVRRIDFLFENKQQITFEYEEKDKKQIVQISQNNILEETTAIVYDIKESLLNTKKVKIIKEADFTTYQFVMYNIKDIYKEILDDMNKQNITDETEDSQNDIEKIQKIYNEYKNMDEEHAEISFNVKMENDRKERTTTSFYLLVYNSKIGIDIVNDKTYIDEIEKTVTLDNSNSIMINNYSRETIKKLIDALVIKGKDRLKNKIEL